MANGRNLSGVIMNKLIVNVNIDWLKSYPYNKDDDLIQESPIKKTSYINESGDEVITLTNVKNK